MTEALDYHREMRAGIDAKLAALPSSSYVRGALPKDRLDAAFADACRQLEEAGGNASTLISFPPLVLFCDRRSVSQIEAFEEDLQHVIRHSKRKSPEELTQFLCASTGRGDGWSGALFELSVKARLLRIPGLAVDFDVLLANGRETDALVYWSGKTLCVECSVIGESEEDWKAWARFLASQKIRQDSVYVRPGPFDEGDARSPSPYYDAVRVYGKVYDKLANRLDPRRSQFLPDTPSVVALSIWAPTTPLDANSPGVRWALDELFADQPRKRTIAEGEPGIDISLGGCIDFAMRDLGLGVEERAERGRQLIAAPRGLGGVVLFNECRIGTARMNYHARTACRLTHEDMARLEAWLGRAPYWM
jgi:hypothetical protein